MSTPEMIDAGDYWRAVKPLYDLLGVSPMNVFAEPRMHHGPDDRRFIRFNMAVDGNSQERLDWPVTVLGEGDAAEYVYEVEIPIEGEFTPRDLGYPRCASTPVPDQTG